MPATSVLSPLQQLISEGLDVAPVQTEPTLHRLRATDGTEVSVVDLGG